MIDFVDVVVDLQYGDCGKGKVTNALLGAGNYTHCMRYNGGGNAGHTIYENGKKIVTHYIPAGVLHGIVSIIGPGCVVYPEKLLEEIKDLEDAGFEVKKYLRIAKNVHVTTDSHVWEDSQDVAIGTCRSGNGPTYRDKYNRSGETADNKNGSLPSHVAAQLKPYLIDVYEEFYGNKTVRILMEGAQGFGLDIDWGDYPYVTSSHCTTGGAILNGVPWSKIRKVYGLAKAYETYVGTKDFQGKDPIFNKIGDAGNEYGATTGRRRKVNWLDTDLMSKAIILNGVTDVIINKMDVLNEVGVYGIRNTEGVKKFISEAQFHDALLGEMRNKLKMVGKMDPVNFTFSYSPETI